MYVFNTWLLANLFHPLVLILFFGKGLSEQQGTEIMGIYFYGFIISFIFSSPVLVIAHFIFRLIKRSRIDVIQAFIIWLFTASVIPFVLVFILSMMVLNTDTLLEDIGIIIPSMIAAFASISIRLNQFIKTYFKVATIQTDFSEVK